MHVLEIEAKAGAHNGVLSFRIPHPPATAWATSCRRSGSRTTCCRAGRSTGRPARALAKVFERHLGYQWQATWPRCTRRIYVWTVSAMRMKREHRVPPCRRALQPSTRRGRSGSLAARRSRYRRWPLGCSFVMATEAMPRRCVAGRWRPWYRPTVNIEIVTTVPSGAAVLIGVWRMLAKTEGIARSLAAAYFTPAQRTPSLTPCGSSPSRAITSRPTSSRPARPRSPRSARRLPTSTRDSRLRSPTCGPNNGPKSLASAPRLRRFGPRSLLSKPDSSAGWSRPCSQRRL